MDEERKTYTVPEVARLLGISRAHAYELIRIGRVPAIRLGRRVVVPRRSLDEFLDSGTTERRET